ncbi:unnamed protein product [Orchesella dallaii]|uniref:Uncharacterized protein n=1 Tax=Orchesella dallaii TaxID=48710 RepID=A0ABP1PXZ6_9HEXA
MELLLNQNRQHQLTLEEEEDDAEDWSDDSITDKKMPFVNEWVDQLVKVQSQQTIHLDVNRQMEHEDNNQQSCKPRLRSIRNADEKLKVNPTAFLQERFPQPPPLYKCPSACKSNTSNGVSTSSRSGYSVDSSVASSNASTTEADGEVSSLTDTRSRFATV